MVRTGWLVGLLVATSLALTLLAILQPVEPPPATHAPWPVLRDSRGWADKGCWRDDEVVC
jgi:hypothetical protein